MSVDDRCDLLCLDLERAEALRRSRLEPSAAWVAAERARALADPTRLTLAAALARADELCVCDLAWIAERSQNLVSHHLRALRAAELVGSRREGKLVMYTLTATGRALLDPAIIGVAEVSRHLISHRRKQPTLAAQRWSSAASEAIPLQRRVRRHEFA